MSTIIVVGKDDTLAGSTAVHRHTTSTDNVIIFRKWRQAITYLAGNEVDAVLVLQSWYIVSRIRAKYKGSITLMNIGMNDDAIKGVDGSLLRILQSIRVCIHQCGTRRLWQLPIAVSVPCWGWLLRLFGRELIIARWYTGRIGHLAYNTHILMAEAAKYKHPVIVGVRADDMVCNQQLIDMYKRHMVCDIKNATIMKALHMPVARRSRFFRDANWYGDVHKPLQNINNDDLYLAFTPQEREHGNKLESIMGLHDWWVCLHARDNTYLSTIDTKTDWQYHNFRDCDIKTYMPAAQQIQQAGGTAVRMGAVVSEPLSTDAPAIDYACQHRSDFGDIWLLANCRYLLGSCTGVTQIATVFGVPVAIANWTHLEFTTCFRGSDIMIPKGVWSVDSKEFLTLPQILHSGAGRYIRAEQYQKAGLELVDNTAEEIAALSAEMLMRLNGDWMDTDEQAARQGRWHAIINNPDYRCNKSPVRVGAQWLVEHPGWLG